MMKFEERPFIAIWETTQACDLVCKHCRAAARPERDAAELSTEEAQNLLDSFARADVPLVILTGGDPAKRPDLVELVRYGSEVGLTMGLTPSATPLVTPGLLAELAEAGLKRLAISIDGLEPDVHDTFRGRPGSFARSLELLRAARAAGLATQVNTTLHPGTIGHLHELAQLMKELRITLWSVFVVVPTGRATVELMPGADAVEEALNELLSLAGSCPFAIKTTAGPHYRRVALEHKKAGGQEVTVGTRGKQAMWVNEGRGFLFVSHRGEVYPSGFLPVACGNVRDEDPIDIYKSHPTFRLLRDSDSLKGKCGVCNYRNVCGGARARAYSMRGDLMASDPLCNYVPPGYTGQLDIFNGAPEKGRLRVLAQLELQSIGGMNRCVH
jgi:radical SAM protein